MQTKEAALFWLDSGVATVPLIYRSKKPAVTWTPYRTRLPALAEIDAWYQWPRNLALVTGWNGLLVLDFDSIENWAAWHVWQLMYQPEIIQTYRVQSNRGIHVYYWLRESVCLNSVQSALFEIKTGGRLVTAPPSIHESGRPYRPLDDPANIKIVKVEQILNYSPVVFPPIVFPLRRCRSAPHAVINDSGIDEIKKGISILQFVPDARPVDASQRYWRGACPLHGHKDNFWVDTQLGSSGCFAGCTGSKSVDVLDLYQLLNNCDLKTAIQELRRFL